MHSTYNIRCSKLAAIAAITFVGATTQAATLAVSPTSMTVTHGQSFNMGLEGQGFSVSILGGGFNLDFNPSVLRLDDIRFPSSWEFFTSKGAINNSAGHVSDATFNSFASPRSGAFNVATLTFTAVGSGISDVKLSSSAAFPFGDTVGNSVGVSFANGSVTAVPEPSELGMLLAGLGIVAWASRCRSGARSA